MWANIQGGNFNIPDISTYSHYQLYNSLKYLRTSGISEIAEIENQSKSNYVLTTDNYLKMNVIYLRIQSKIPVIIMGETGCGKTSLIRYLCETIRYEEIKIFNIHAGVTT